MRFLVKWAFVALVSLHVLAAAWFSHRAYEELSQPRDLNPNQRIIKVKKGQTLRDVLHMLHARQLMPDPDLTHLAIRLFKPETVIKSGTYRLPDRVSSWELIELLHQGNVALFKLTLPEGLDIWEVAALLGQSQWGSQDAFMAIISDGSRVHDLDNEADTLEGYLLPETYMLPADASPEDVINVILNQFRSETETLRMQAQAAGFTTRQWVTLASLIEKETALAEERYLISGVFHRRLQKNMLLQCDPTIIYALKKMGAYKGKIHRSEIKVDHAYNTYVYPGIPPGPIASAGLAALEAAVNPADHDYLFFVARNDGSHYFSKTLREHDRAVRQYQR